MKMTDDMGIIYQRYYGDLYRFCISMCNSPELAEDICHETFYKALKSTKTYDGDCKVISWLCQIAKNTYISYLRKEKRMVKSEEIERLMENVAGTGNSLQEKVEDAESASEIRVIMNSLAIGQIHMEAGQNYHSKIYYLLDENTVNAFVKHTKTGVSVDGYPTYENKRWDFVEMFGVKKQ